MPGPTILTRWAVAAVVTVMTPLGAVAGTLGTAGAAPPFPDHRCADVPFVGVCAPMWEKPTRARSAPIGAVMIPEMAVNPPEMPVMGG